MSETLSKKIGNIKKRYPHDDYNPFKAIEWLYDNALHTGTGHTVLLVGHTERFQKDSIKALSHVLASKKLLVDGDELPVLKDGEFFTHTGVVLRFVGLADIPQNQLQFQAHCKESSIVALCSTYKSPDFLNVIREVSHTKLVYDFSKNNEKEVDK